MDENRTDRTPSDGRTARSLETGSSAAALRAPKAPRVSAEQDMRPNPDQQAGLSRRLAPEPDPESGLEHGPERTEAMTRLLVEFYERFSSWEQAVVRESGLTLPQMHTIEIIGALGEPRMKELAGAMGVSTGALTVLVDRLVRAGLVDRLQNPDDRRSIRVSLTEAGRRHYDEHHGLHLHLTRELAGALSHEETAVFMDMLARLNERF